MAGITLERAQAHLDSWMEADLKVAGGQAYSIGGRSLTRANAKEIRDNITFWSRQVDRLTGGRSGPRVRGVTPV